VPARKHGKALKWDKEKTRELFLQYKKTEDPQIRDQIIAIYANLVEYLARRFKNRGEPLEDLVQVGIIGIIKAIDRFDIERQVEFTTYATPTIIGELKRYFRDKSWAVRVPRRLQELNFQINKPTGTLTQKLGRSPTIAEIAHYLGVSQEDVIEAIETGEAYSFVSLEGTSNEDEEKSFSLLEYIGQEDKELANLEDRASLMSALSGLSRREQQIIYLRFFKGLTQTEIASRLGISQMHVSRILRDTLQNLRQILALEGKEASSSTVLSSLSKDSLSKDSLSKDKKYGRLGK